MARAQTIHRCGECGGSTPRWAGRCPACGAWNALVEERAVARAPSRPAARGVAFAAVPLTEIAPEGGAARSTGLPELDRVLGGGLVPGSVTLVGGEPGIGKSTLLLQVLAAMAGSGARGLLVSAEESPVQVQLRAERLDALHPSVWLLSETLLPTILGTAEEIRPDVVVVDSIQTVSDPDLDSAPGSVAQVRECAHQLVGLAKQQAVTTLLVGHVTKDGALAGPRVLEHLVDTVLSFEGERHHALRLLRAVKHRFGATGELGLFEMAEQGLVAVPDASGLFLADRRQGTPGSVVLPAMEGQRPLLVEVQALVAGTTNPMPRRTASGLDGGRLHLVLAVLERRARLRIPAADIYASVIGGVRVNEPAADLAMALALASAHTGVAVPHEVVACGEIGLGGEVRQVAHLARRLAEAARLGFRTAVVPAASPDGPPGLELIRVNTLGEALASLEVNPRRESLHPRR
ncbi:MAG TPA: DNA repair protein RadA [Acidimicrobiales bacterium]